MFSINSFSGFNFITRNVWLSYRQPTDIRYTENGNVSSSITYLYDNAVDNIYMVSKTTEEEKRNIVLEYSSGINTGILSKKYNISSVAIRGLLKRRGVSRRTQTILQRKYTINETYFDNIDSEDKAYFLGLLYADGNNNEERRCVSLQLIEKDKDILIEFARKISSNNPLKYVNSNPTNSWKLNIYNKHISEKLHDVGCPQRKTFILKYPEFLDDELQRHFIRGYFDGDGGLTVSNKNYSFSVTSTESFCNTINNILQTRFKIHSGIYNRHKRNNIVTLTVSGNLQILRIMGWLYKDTSLFLKRKHQKYLEIKGRQCYK